MCPLQSYYNITMFLLLYIASLWFYCFIFFSFIFISWRLITSQYCSGFCHTLTWISHGFTCIPHPDPPSHLRLYPIYCFLTRDLYLLIPFTYFIHPSINTLKRNKWTNKILCIIMLTRILIRIINGHSHSLSILDSSSILLFHWRIRNIWLQWRFSVLTNIFPEKPNTKGSEEDTEFIHFLGGCSLICIILNLITFRSRVCGPMTHFCCWNLLKEI